LTYGAGLDMELSLDIWRGLAEGLMLVIANICLPKNFEEKLFVFRSLNI
jgi:hypothetical protein